MCVVLAFWRWIAIGVLLYLVVAAAPVAWRELSAEREAGRQHCRELAERADAEHAAVMKGENSSG